MTIKQQFFQFARNNDVGGLLMRHIQPLRLQLRETTLDQIEKWAEEERRPIERGDIVHAAKGLEEYKIARFVVGRRGAKSRLEWILDTSDLEEDDDEGMEEGEEETNSFAAVTAPTTGSSPEKSAVIEHIFRVRPDFSITLKLPDDFSTSEAERLAAFVKALPF